MAQFCLRHLSDDRPKDFYISALQKSARPYPSRRYTYQLARSTLELIERAGRYIDERDKGEQTFEGQKYKNLSADHQKDVVSKIVPWLRGQVSQQNRFVATIESTKAALEFVNSHESSQTPEQLSLIQ